MNDMTSTSIDYEKYEVVQRFPILKAYLEHFNRTSMDNAIPGLLSFFFIQGQIAVQYVRLPTGDGYIDPRVHVFWIQPSRSGKSIAWNFIGDVLSNVDIPHTMYTTGTDAGLIGSMEKVEVGEGKDKTYEIVKKDGLLSGRKALNFDEGSIVLTPGKFSQETVLYLQSACNPVGTENNKLVKHMRDGMIENESLVSMWITTYPPKGVKEYVLTRGIFQRVLLYWGDWDMEQRDKVSQMRLSTFFQKPDEASMSKEDLYEYFNGLNTRLRNRVLELSETSFIEWDAMEREEQEELIQSCMWEAFTCDENYEAALHSAADEIYELVGKMDPTLSEVIASFTPGIENYLGIFSMHIAMLDESWEVKGEYVDMAHEILYDLFVNLITWLEDEVDVGMKASEMAVYKEAWQKAYSDCGEYELDGRGPGWRRKSIVYKAYQASKGCAAATTDRHYKQYAADMFTTSKEGSTVYIRMKGATV